MIEASGLCMRYGSFSALADATFSARRGEVVGLLGPNGAGKTTTMRILTTYLVPTAGTARVAGHDVVAEPLEVRRRIGYLPEQLPLYLAMEVRECLTFVGRARGLRGTTLRERVEWVVEACGLADMFHTPVSQLSKGFRQRTGLAQALVHDPEVVILDEPTTGLDPHQIVEIRALVRSLAATKTVILSTHILQEASALADRLLVVSGGRIVGEGTSEELLRKAGVRTTVTVAFAAPVEGAAAALAALVGPEGLHAADDGKSFTLTEQEEGLAARVGSLARERGWHLVELHRRPPTLEEAFLALTKRSGGHLHASPAPPAAGSPALSQPGSAATGADDGGTAAPTGDAA